MRFGKKVESLTFCLVDWGVGGVRDVVQGLGKEKERDNQDSKALIVFGRAGRRTDESSSGKGPGSFHQNRFHHAIICI